MFSIISKKKFRNLLIENHLIRLYLYLKKLNYKIIVKTRPKDDNIPENLKGDIFICSDKFPNESLELMKICDLCILFSSSAVDETLFCEIPCIDIKIDNSVERNNFLKLRKIYKIIDNFNLSAEKLTSIINNLEKKILIFIKNIKKNIYFHI